jgi:putative protease
MKKIELLSPARDADHGIAAIASGADAVYIGATRFGARSSAANDPSQIERLASYAHLYNAKVYVTLNTVLFDEELGKAKSLAREVWNAGADALIIQDMAMVEADLPPIPLFASTQMHNDTPEKIKFLEQVGFSRAILARELSLDQIAAIHKTASIELESFIHGALCVSFSGQCFMSYCAGGRSGNRGECAQPCRKKYDLLDADGTPLIQGKYLLSLKDLNLTGYLRRMIDAGVSSFKIEGRLKDMSYVRNVTSHYRKAIDALLGAGETKSSSGTSVIEFIPDPAKTFNRGFTAYFIEGRTGQVSSIDTPKPAGELIGSVVSCAGKNLTVKTASALTAGDGLCFFDVKGELTGGSVNSVNGPVLTLNEAVHAKAGSVLFRNRDHLFEKSLSQARQLRQISVSVKLKKTPSGMVCAEAVDEDGMYAFSGTGQEWITPEDPSRAQKMIVQQMSKSGGTSFFVASVEIEGEPFFMPVSSVNGLRRSLLDELENVRREAYTKDLRRAGDVSAIYPLSELGFEGNVTNKEAEDFYARHGTVVRERGAEKLPDLSGRKVMTTKYCLRYELGLCVQHPRRGILSGTRPKEPMTLVSGDHRFRLAFSCADCVMEIYDC